MDVIARLLKNRWGASALSAIVSLLAAIAILTLNAPPAIFILSLWAAITADLELSSRIDRRARRR
jgi:hypothetical protein